MSTIRKAARTACRDPHVRSLALVRPPATCFDHPRWSVVVRRDRTGVWKMAQQVGTQTPRHTQIGLPRDLRFATPKRRIAGKPSHDIRAGQSGSRRTSLDTDRRRESLLRIERSQQHLECRRSPPGDQDRYRPSRIASHPSAIIPNTCSGYLCPARPPAARSDRPQDHDQKVAGCGTLATAVER